MSLDHRVLFKLEIASRPLLCFSSSPRKATKLDEVMSWLTSGLGAMTNDPLL